MSTYFEEAEGVELRRPSAIIADGVRELAGRKGAGPGFEYLRIDVGMPHEDSDQPHTPQIVVGKTAGFERDQRLRGKMAIRKYGGCNIKFTFSGFYKSTESGSKISVPVVGLPTLRNGSGSFGFSDSVVPVRDFSLELDCVEDFAVVDCTGPDGSRYIVSKTNLLERATAPPYNEAAIAFAIANAGTLALVGSKLPESIH